MKHYIAILSLCLGPWLFATPGQADLPFLNMELSEVRDMAGRKGSLYFAYFTADWCAPCKWMEEQTFRDPALVQYVSNHYLAVRVDIDQRNGRIEQERYEVRMLPSILIFNAQGQLLAKVETAVSGKDLLDILREYDQPNNRIGSATSLNNGRENVLDSPKPKIRIYRPPLPSESGADAQAPAPSPQAVRIEPASPDRPPVMPEVAHIRESLAPRSELVLSIQMGAYESYEQAVRQTAQIESSLDAPVRMLRGVDEQGRSVYRIFIGNFTNRKQAEDYLFYLRRKHLGGIIQDMREVQIER